jgi:hypothetical protein
MGEVVGGEGDRGEAYWNVLKFAVKSGMGERRALGENLEASKTCPSERKSVRGRCGGGFFSPPESVPYYKIM